MSQGAKVGYGPKEPKPMRGASPEANANAEPRVIKGFAGSPDKVRAAAASALSAGAAARKAGATHADTEAFNVSMSELQQHDSLAHASVLAIHHLEKLIANGQETKQTRTQLKQAHSNLRARLNTGAQRNYPS